MLRWVLRSQGREKFVAGAAHVACTDGQDGIASSRFREEVPDARLHGWEIINMLVAGFADGVNQRFAGDAVDGRFAGWVDVGEHEDVSEIESATEFVPQMLRAR